MARREAPPPDPRPRSEVNYSTQDLKGAVDEITGGAMADVIYEVCGPAKRRGNNSEIHS